MSAHREAQGYLPSYVTLLVMSNIRLSELEYALAGKFEIYCDVRENLCLRTVEDGKAHRELVAAERQARLDHARRHAEIVRIEGERNRVHGYRSCQDETAMIVNGKWVCNCAKAEQPLAGSAEHRAQDEIAPQQYRPIPSDHFAPAETVPVRQSIEDEE
jgi:hypothetical protein